MVGCVLYGSRKTHFWCACAAVSHCHSDAVTAIVYVTICGDVSGHRDALRAYRWPAVTIAGVASRVVAFWRA